MPPLGRLSRHLFERSPQGRPRERQRQRLALGAADRAAEVLVERIERVRRGFLEGPTELLLDAIDLMKELAAIAAELAHAELPIGAEQEVIIEDAPAEAAHAQHALRGEYEIGQEFLVAEAVGLRPAVAGAMHLAVVGAGKAHRRRALLEAAVAGAEDRSLDAVAGPVLFARLYQAQAEALDAMLLREGEGIGLRPDQRLAHAHLDRPVGFVAAIPCNRLFRSSESNSTGRAGFGLRPASIETTLAGAFGLAMQLKGTERKMARINSSASTRSSGASPNSASRLRWSRVSSRCRQALWPEGSISSKLYAVPMCAVV